MNFKHFFFLVMIISLISVLCGCPQEASDNSLIEIDYNSLEYKYKKTYFFVAPISEYMPFMTTKNAKFVFEYNKNNFFSNIYYGKVTVSIDSYNDYYYGFNKKQFFVYNTETGNLVVGTKFVPSSKSSLLYMYEDSDDNTVMTFLRNNFDSSILSEDYDGLPIAKIELSQSDSFLDPNCTENCINNVPSFPHLCGMYSFSNSLITPVAGAPSFFVLDPNVVVDENGIVSGGGSGSGSGSASVAGTYTFNTATGTQANGSIVLNADGTWSYSGSKANVAASSGTYTINGNQITISWIAGINPYSETVTINTSGTSSSWSANNMTLFSMLFGVINSSMTFSYSN